MSTGNAAKLLGVTVNVVDVVEDRIKLPKIGVVRLGVDLNTGSIDLSNKVSIILPKPLKALGRSAGR